MTARSGQVKPTGFWTIFRLLVGTSRRRARGRQRRQQQLLSRRRNNQSTDWSGLSGVMGLFLAAVTHGAAAYVLSSAVQDGRQADAERTGKIVVDDWFKKQVEEALTVVPPAPVWTWQDHATDSLRGNTPPPPGLALKTETLPSSGIEKGAGGQRTDPHVEQALATPCHQEASYLALKEGGSEDAIEAKLRAAVARDGARGLIARSEIEPDKAAPGGPHSIAALLGSVVLLWWAAMLVFQGEGLELDLQRRRHPMWEWLFSHPVPASAVFAAEVLAPIAANPVYWGAPLFVGFAFGMVYDAGLGFVAALAVGAPVAVAAACLGKALEIGCTLRFSPRTRGGLLGLMSWFGYASLMLLILSAASASKVAGVAGHWLAPLTAAPWPWLGWFLGQTADGGYSFARGLLACWAAAGVATALAVRFCVWGAARGLSGNFGAEGVVVVAASKRTKFGREPLYRKEFLWFARDRSAIVQTILIPLTVAGFQLFNLRYALAHAQDSWNYLCGAAILFGTYFLWVLGPKSLASEGPALWLSLTWPRGLENLLKAKAWLWAMISTGIVSLILGYGIFLFPAEAWKVALVGVGWFVFGRSMAEKTVTLVTVTSSSGDPEPIPRGRRWAASLGMLTFAIGVLTQQWSFAVVGVVYSYLTAAAMWENFRARLPFLYDPWSEKLPPSPTLMHAMVAISILVECTAVVVAPFVLVFGRESVAVAQGIAYILCALCVAVGTGIFLDGRGVKTTDVWRWPGKDGGGSAAAWWCGDGSYGGRFWRALLAGIVGAGCLE